LQLDAHLSPAIATWITDTFAIAAFALRDLGLRDAEDSDIFAAAKSSGVIFMTKDSDFVDLVVMLLFRLNVCWSIAKHNQANMRSQK